MKILITGGTGFIGSRMAEALGKEGGHEIFFTGRRNAPPPHLGSLPAAYLAGSLEDASFAARAADGMDAIVHCAGLAGTWGQEEAYRKANVEATLHLLEAARRGGVRRFVNLSSPSIYFDFCHQFALKEDELPRKLSNAYARTKYEAELLVRSFHSSSLETVSLRPRSVIGRGDRNILPRLIRLQQKGALAELGDGKNEVDITTIGNLLHAIDLCLKGPSSAFGETYNISNGRPVRFWDFVEEVLQAAGLPPQRKRLPLWPVMAAARINEIYCRAIGREEEPALLPIAVGVIAYSMTLDISKARARLGYEPKFTTSDGIREYFS